MMTIVAFSLSLPSDLPHYYTLLSCFIMTMFVDYPADIRK